MRKTPLKKRVTRSNRPRSNVDPTRAAIAALERIRTVLVNSGHEGRLGAPMSMKELAAQAQFLGMELPPSYVAAMRVASKIGDPEAFLVSDEMAAEADEIIAYGGEEARRYAPFCRAQDKLVCFDRGGGKRQITAVRYQGELPIVEWQDGSANPIAAHFGEWLDMVADAREESVESAAKMPQRLKRLLYELGFRFEYPVVGRLETGDVDAIEELIGQEHALHVRGEVDRLFDSSGKASLTLNVDEFTLAVSLRTGIFVYGAEDVFRWLRYFRDENFFGEDSATRGPSHPDAVRDLRRAAREAPLVMRGVMHVPTMPASEHVFRAASGTSATDFYLLGRTGSTSEHASSVVLHVVDGIVATRHVVDEPLNDLYVARDGSMWGLTTTHAVRFTGGRTKSFALRRPTHGRPWWYGIGGAADRVIVWGAGALLEFAGDGFVPFDPDAMLDDTESVVALVSHGVRVSALVCGDRMGAVARFDGMVWQPITEDQVIDANLADFDVWRGSAFVLDRDGGIWRVDKGPPHTVNLPIRQQAFLTEAGTPRPFHSVRAFDGGLLLASNGGVVVAHNTKEPVFHAAPGCRDPVRLVRIGDDDGRASDGKVNREAGIVALSGPHAWVFRNGSFNVLDMREL
ncbi:hypothetical protein [Labilithrix luteola]|uniref:hypothetical protein n=1 Tax=Labilithrix luteola TaxID=1391654 RepID=UPI0011BAD473|nr:hypothetical protein [Labilithrix luteola]